MSTKSFLSMLALFGIAMTATAADGGGAVSLTGTIKDAAKSQGAAATLGAEGARVLRTRAQWDALQERLIASGWNKPPANPLSEVDFAREMIVCFFQFGDEGNAFSVRRAAAGDSTELDILMSYIIYKQRGEPANTWKFICAAIPRAQKVALSISTYHPMNGGPYPTADKALLEWKTVLGEDSGDIVAGLQARAKAKSDTAKPGDDILVEITLSFANPAQAKAGHFAADRNSVHVWDGKYSNGYRNHSFLVKLPDGNTKLLRPKVIDAWDKNAPHLVEIAAGKPYVLPGPFEGQTFKSLKELGLDTAQPGAYEITAIYEECGGVDTMRQSKKTAWGGQIASNTIIVTLQ